MMITERLLSLETEYDQLEHKLKELKNDIQALQAIVARGYGVEIGQVRMPTPAMLREWHGSFKLPHYVVSFFTESDGRLSVVLGQYPHSGAAIWDIEEVAKMGLVENSPRNVF